jgi:hypothetical protein
LFARLLKPFFDSIGQKQTSTGYSSRAAFQNLRGTRDRHSIKGGSSV